jgi:two-component sensor histidine kinase
MSLHELATNAAKYGALSSNEGRVELRWVIDGDTGSRLRMIWSERGGPLVKPPSRKGFGTRLIQRGLAAELGGSVSLDYAEAGLVCIIDAPVPQLTSAG